MIAAAICLTPNRLGCSPRFSCSLHPFVSLVTPPSLYVNDLGYGPQGFVHSITVRKLPGHVGIKDHNIRTLGISARILSTYPVAEVIVSAHFVVFTSFLLHMSSVQTGLPFAH